ncbi:LuxR C-terminal-related transcriptional regulator [Arthrobacter sp. CG_A4]|uniref:LuxR C-terminal-related transcriptional regulator n=1 Tax=Arthrobacter sp. CG_A4 TaxID=3071706 RepID=UPI002DFA5EF3|nr:DNA-binding CsgD family transcriptional regulator [Arthrobacter sp. CG_A4]
MESRAETAPLVGRSGMVRDIVRCLRDDAWSGALIVGSAGAGKTAVSKAVIRELRPRGRVIRLTATRALAAVPFGALAPYLAGLPDHELDSYAAVLAAMTGSLRSEAGRPLFVIDDAQSLDRGTVQLLARAVATGAASILAATRPGPMIPEEFLALWDDGIISKFDLSPLNRADVHQLCELLLRADVSPWASAVFYSVTDGNPLMLMSLIEHARARGALGLRDGVWYLLSRPELAGVPAADVVDQQLRSMTPEERTVATIVALAGPLPLGQLLNFSSPKAVDALETAGLIGVSPGHDRVLRPASAVLGEIIRRRVPAGQSAALRASLLALPSSAAALPDAFLNQLLWSMDCGAEVPPGQLVQAAAVANTDLDPATAIKVAGAVAAGPYLPDARVQLAYSSYILGRPEEAAGRLLAARPLRYGRLSYLAALLAARLPAPTTSAPTTSAPTTPAPTTAQTPLLPTPENGATVDPGDRPSAGLDEPLWTQSPAAAMAADIMNGRRGCRFPDLESGLQELVRAAGNNPEIFFPAASLLAELWTAQGKLLAGLQLDREAWHGMAGPCLTIPLVHEDVLLRHCLILIRAGKWEELAESVDHYAAEHPGRLLYSGGTLHALQGFSRLRQGRIPDCLAELKLGVEELKIFDLSGLLPFAHSVAAYAAALLGRRDEARAHAQAYRTSEYGEPLTFRLLAEAYCRTVELLTGDGGSVQGDTDGEPGAGQRSLQMLAEEARDQGLRSVETDIRRLLLRSGDTEGAQALALSSSAVEGPEARLLEALSLAVSAADAAGLIGISDEALAAGQVLLALEAAQQAESCLVRHPDRWKLSAVQRRVHQRMVEAGMTANMDVVRSGYGMELTAREAEILELVAGGAANADIATALCVSQRTVEGHLYRIFAKLGVSHRAELLDDERDTPGS